ncbi:MAG: hypothetical protein HDS45_02115 [Bacteroides sp.]|nr:hypothetical protein [Bacteroides sp.]
MIPTKLTVLTDYRNWEISHWNFYKLRRHHLIAEKSCSTRYYRVVYPTEIKRRICPSSVTAMEKSINPGRKLHTQSEVMTIECPTSRGDMVRISGKMSAELITTLKKVYKLLLSAKNF